MFWFYWHPTTRIQMSVETMHHEATSMERHLPEGFCLFTAFYLECSQTINTVYITQQALNILSC